MQPVRLTLLFAALNLVAPVSGPLTVLRVYPTEPADPRTEITVTFDRPIAAGLDANVPAERIFRIEPAVAGKVEWRDPVTLRFVPDDPLTPGATYTVTIANDFGAMDGSRLEGPYRFEVRIKPSRVIAGDPVGDSEGARFISARPLFRLLLSAAADPRLFAARSAVVMNPACGGARIGLDVVRMRRVTEQDPSYLRYNELRGPVGDSVRDLRRILELRPQRDLPLGCAAILMTPQDALNQSGLHEWAFSTYGPLQVAVVECARDTFCPTGPIRLHFTTPVKGSELVKHVRIAPALEYQVRDTTEESAEWVLETRLKPREHYAVVIDSSLTDVFGQKLRVQAVKPFRTTSYEPSIAYELGRLLVERQGFRTLPVQVVNLDTIVVTSIPIPEAQEADFLSRSWNWDEPFQALMERMSVRKVPLQPELDKPFITGVPFAANDARVTKNGTLVAVRITRPGTPANPEEMHGISLIQVTDLAVHGRIGIDQGMVWVTGVKDGLPRANAVVSLYDKNGKVRATARTDAQGLARLTNFRPPSEVSECEGWCGDFEGYLAAVLNDDRAVVGLSVYDPDLAPWRFDISGAWSDEQRVPAAGAVFTERGIYRPGERVYAKAIVRRGPLGALTLPGRGDSLRWVFTDREAGTLKDTTVTLSAFGTAEQTMQLGAEVPLGDYRVELSVRANGEWQTLARTFYSVAEYRPPEFLVDVTAPSTPRFAGDSITAHVSARYLFGAPMAGAPVRWVLQQRELSPWDLEIPNTDGWNIGDMGDFDYENWESAPEVEVAREGVDTLDARGALDLKVGLPAPRNGRGARTGILAVVTDANRQTVTAGASVLVHPASFYIGAKVRGNEYFWRAGTPVVLDIITVRPTGERVGNVAVSGAIIRREWHRARRTRDGEMNEMGNWVSDTVARCNVRTASEPVSCNFTPSDGGSYVIALSAKDERNRSARTTMWRWAAGKGWVPWRDETELRMEIIPDKQRYTVGDTATLLLASPFTDVEAWVTVERERVLESRRIRITAGATTIKVPITEAHAPNAFVSVLLVRGRSAAPGPADDPGRPTLRVGYAELKVLPAVKKLTVEVAPLQPEYRPGDSARVRVNVKDMAGRGQRSEVTLWAVDEGVLALTGYQTPDPVELIYQPRGLGVRLASNLVSVAKQIPAGQKGQREAGGGGGNDISGILRSRFQTTAFFIGSLVTDANGNATASAKLPDNLTTFRIMAVAVTAGDRYGSGKSSMIVTRPLVARASLPRFVREGDRFVAGVVVNQRSGDARNVQVDATARGIRLSGANKKSETLNGAAGREVRFDFQAEAGDTAHFQFAVAGGGNADAVAVKIPVKPSYHPLAQTIAGVLHDTTTAVFTLEEEVDPAKSRLEISFGGSVLAVVQGARRSLRVYPYYCTEQVSSSALPLIALYRAQKELGTSLVQPEAERDIATAIRIIARRQRPDGGIGYWGPNDWASPWLTAYAGRVLIEAQGAGFAVDTMVLTGIANYLTRSLQDTEQERIALVRWYEQVPIRLGEKVAAVDLLSRLGRPDIPNENMLLASAAQLRWEDRLVLAEALMRRGDVQSARGLLTAAWQGVIPEGRRLALPPAAYDMTHYFRSSARPAARLLTATMVIQPDHPQLGALVETLVLQGRAQVAEYYWNTQDLGNTVLALSAFERTRRQSSGAVVRISGARGALVSQQLSSGAMRDTSFALTGLVNGTSVRLSLTAERNTAPVYYYLTVREVPKVRPVKPVQHGIQVERWYEKVDTKTPTMTVVEGDLVRVKLRITVPEERQFLVLDDPLPAGLEAVDLSLRTMSPMGAWDPPVEYRERGETDESSWYYGSWDAGFWSPFDHKEIRDDRVVYSATLLWKGTYTATYLARATTAGSFVVPPAHAEEMYNPAVNGRTGGGIFTVTRK